jgi:hypothetical protein
VPCFNLSHLQTSIPSISPPSSASHTSFYISTHYTHICVPSSASHTSCYISTHYTHICVNLSHWHTHVNTHICVMCTNIWIICCSTHAIWVICCSAHSRASRWVCLAFHLQFQILQYVVLLHLFGCTHICVHLSNLLESALARLSLSIFSFILGFFWNRVRSLLILFFLTLIYFFFIFYSFLFICFNWLLLEPRPLSLSAADYMRYMIRYVLTTYDVWSDMYDHTINDMYEKIYLFFVQQGSALSAASSLFMCVCVFICSAWRDHPVQKDREGEHRHSDARTHKHTDTCIQTQSHTGQSVQGKF